MAQGSRYAIESGLVLIIGESPHRITVTAADLVIDFEHTVRAWTRITQAWRSEEVRNSASKVKLTFFTYVAAVISRDLE